jgi:hypothetical protein
MMTADKCGSALHALHALGAEPPRVARKKKILPTHTTQNSKTTAKSCAKLGIGNTPIF